ncbi:hypothetical protein ACTXT7_004980 [Hymenolepis weldensis]
MDNAMKGWKHTEHNEDDHSRICDDNLPISMEKEQSKDFKALSVRAQLNKHTHTRHCNVKSWLKSKGEMVGSCLKQARVQVEDKVRSDSVFFGTNFRPE